MTDVYKRLAEKFDEIPNGFPATDSGIEVRILKKIFTPEEAETALKLRHEPEWVEAIAERFGKSEDETQAILDDMVLKGEIGTMKMEGKQLYMLMPFVLGFYEHQFLRKDKDTKWFEEFVELVEEYFPYLGEAMAGRKPELIRVIPVSTEIKEDLRVHRYEDVRRMVNEAKSFQLQECMCRTEQKLLGNRCKYPLDLCLNFSNEENAYERYPQLGKFISREEALEVIDRVEQMGLVHLSYNVADGQNFVCACCPCCCGVLRMVRDFNVPSVLAKSNFVASIDMESCTACGICKDERCPMDAIAEDNGEYSVVKERCIGCGACAPTCPVDAITLIRKPEAERDEPPADYAEWDRRRAASKN